MSKSFLNTRTEHKPSLSSPEIDPNKFELPLNTYSKKKCQCSYYVFGCPNCPKSLVSHCIEIIALNMDDFREDAHLFASYLPLHVKLALLAIARRRKILNDDLLLAMVDPTWTVLDVSNSAVSDLAMCEVAKICTSLISIDISNCDKLTTNSIDSIIKCCRNLTTLKLGGSRVCSSVAKSSLSKILPKIERNEEDEVEEDWEEINLENLIKGLQSLKWMVWRDIDVRSKKKIAKEAPKIRLNPEIPLSKKSNSKSSSNAEKLQNSYPNSNPKLISKETSDAAPELLCALPTDFPAEVFSGVQLDDRCLTGLEPWVWCYPNRTREVPGSEIIRPVPSVAEKFRWAFMKRDERMEGMRRRMVEKRRQEERKRWVQESENEKWMKIEHSFLFKLGGSRKGRGGGGRFKCTAI